MLLASLYFWDGTHQTFHFGCGMITPTLFDLAAIVGLKPTGEEFDPFFLNEDSIGFEVSRAAYSTHINHYHDKSNAEVSDIEHIYFLALWLCRYVLCSHSIQVAKKFITIANQLHVGRKLYLSEMILIHLYESLGEGVTLLKTLGDQVNLLLSGPFWLLQLWLNASFKKHLPKLQTPDEESEVINNRATERIRLSQMTPLVEEQSLEKSYTSYVVAFAQRHQFTPSMAPFAFRKVGPDWFVRKFPATKEKDVEESNAIWTTFLTPRVMALRLQPTKNQVALLGYQPNLVCRQFGLVQLLHKPLFSRKNKVLLYNMRYHEKDAPNILAFYSNRAELVPTAFEPCLFTTPEFADWWKHYYSMEFLDVKGFKHQLTIAFSTLQVKKYKGRYTHIREVHAFQKYFETVYRPNNLLLTICEAARTLREKLTAKLDKLKLPSYVTPEKRYETTFNLYPPKFPCLPTSELGVAFRPPFPVWFVCGNIWKLLCEQSHKHSQQVVASKYTLDSF